MSTEAGALQALPGWSLLLVRMVAIGLLAAAAAIVAWTAVPMIWGWTPAVIVSGSMSPLVHRGDIVVTSPPAENWQPAVGQVVTVPDPYKPGTTLTHRIAGFDERGLLITRGDANGSDDRFRTAPSQVRGIARLLVPRIGTATLLLREGRPAMFLAQSVLVLGAVALVSRRLPVTPAESAAPDRPATPTRPAAPVVAAKPERPAPPRRRKARGRTAPQRRRKGPSRAARRPRAAGPRSR